MRKLKKLKQRAFNRNRTQFYLQGREGDKIQSLYEWIRTEAKKRNVILLTATASVPNQSLRPVRTFDDFFRTDRQCVAGLDLELHLNYRSNNGEIMVKSMKNRRQSQL